MWIVSIKEKEAEQSGEEGKQDNSIYSTAESVVKILRILTIE